MFNLYIYHERRIIMNNKLLKVFSLSLVTGMLLNIAPVNTFAYNGTSQYFKNEILDDSNKNNNIDWSLYERFIKYDLCIEDYENLMEDKKNFCKFIFETERADFPNVRCERARRILDNREVTERLTL